MKEQDRNERQSKHEMESWQDCLEMIRQCRVKLPARPNGEDPSPVELELQEIEEQVKAMSTAPVTTYFRQLQRAGVKLPPPGMLNDRELKVRLDQVVQGMARLKIYLGHTDHLSDRELYTELWDGLLHIRVPDVPPNRFTLCFYSMLRVGDTNQDGTLYMKYYAGKKARRAWAREFPDKRLPARQKPPYNRDRHLPKVSPADFLRPEDLKAMEEELRGE